MLRLTLMLLLLLLLLLQWKCRRACATWRMSNGPMTMLCISLAIVHHFVDKLPPLSPLASSGQTPVPHVNLMPWQLQAQQTHTNCHRPRANAKRCSVHARDPQPDRDRDPDPDPDRERVGADCPGARHDNRRFVQPISQPINLAAANKSVSPLSHHDDDDDDDVTMS